MKDMDGIADKDKWHAEYDDGDVDTRMIVPSTKKEFARERAITALGAYTLDVDPDCLTLTRADRVDSDE